MSHQKPNITSMLRSKKHVNNELIWILNCFCFLFFNFSPQKSGKTEKPKADKPKAAETKPAAKGKVEKAAKPAETKPKPAAAANVAKEAKETAKKGTEYQWIFPSDSCCCRFSPCEICD